MADIKLGESSHYTDKYDAGLLSTIARKESRQNLRCSDFLGFDEWTCFELSWLNPRGLPQVAIAVFKFLATSEHIVESKSFKYYLNSYNQTKFYSSESVRQKLQEDLVKVSGAEVGVQIIKLDSEFPTGAVLPGTCVDDIDCDIRTYQPNRSLLHFGDAKVSDRQLYSHLLKSNCPVTGQPDWATLWIQYSGAELVEQSFLKYVVAFRQYQGFHESCVETVFSDLWSSNKVSSLCVYARYTRRGGLDINPIRYSQNFSAHTLPFGRLARQ